MKNILILRTSWRNKDGALFEEAAQKHNVGLNLAEYDDVVIEFNVNETKILINDVLLDSYHIVFFRTVEPRFEELAIVIQNYCRAHGIKIVDKVRELGQSWINRKTWEYTKLSEANLPIIPSFFVSQKQYRSLENQINFSPLIVKETDKDRGQGVHLVENYQDLHTLFEGVQKKHLLIQPFVKNSFDIRVLILGNTILGSIKRQRTNKNEYRNNVSLGAISEPYELTQEESRISQSAADCLSYTFAGIDIIHSDDGQIFILEVNIEPQYNGFMEATGMNVPAKIIEYLAGL